MKSCSLKTFLLTTAFIAFTNIVHAQETPHIAYCYPAGGQAGTSVDITLGGRYLTSTKDVFVSGTGVRAEFIDKVANHKKVMSDYLKVSSMEKRTASTLKPLSEKQIQNLEELKKTIPESGHPMYNEWEKLSAEDLKVAIEKFRTKENFQKTRELDDLAFIRLHIDPSAESGEREIRVTGFKGISNPISFYVNHIIETKELEPNDDIGNISTCARLPVIINGQVKAGDIDHFSFHAEAGQQLIISVQARDLVPYIADAVPGWFQAVLTLHNDAGEKVVYVDDFHFNPDPVIFFRVPKGGSYHLKIHDAIYRGREDFVYRISIAERPYITGIFPLGGSRRQKTNTSVTGWNLPVNTIPLDTAGAKASDSKLSLNKGNLISNHVPYAISDLPEKIESEGNNSLIEFNTIRLNQIANGKISQPGDVDVYRFDGNKGDKVVAEVFARRLHSPLDSLLRLIGENGEVIAVNDDHKDKHNSGLLTHDADSRIEHTLPSNGGYYLMLSDSQSQGGDNYAYRLQLATPKPDYTLFLTPSSVMIPPGFNGPVTIHVERKDGFDGPVTLALTDTPEGFALNGNVIPKNADKMTFTLSVPENIRSRDFIFPKIKGMAQINGKQQVRTAIPADVMQQAFIWDHLVEAQDFIVFAGSPKKNIPAFINDPLKPVDIRVGGISTIKLNIPPSANKQKYEFNVSSSPEGVRLANPDASNRGPLIELATDEAITPGAEGNLIIEVFTTYEVTRGKGDNKTKTGKVQRVSLGTLPAIPFKAVNHTLAEL